MSWHRESLTKWQVNSLSGTWLGRHQHGACGAHAPRGVQNWFRHHVVPDPRCTFCQPAIKHTQNKNLEPSRCCTAELSLAVRVVIRSSGQASESDNVTSPPSWSAIHGTLPSAEQNVTQTSRAVKTSRCAANESFTLHGPSSHAARAATLHGFKRSLRACDATANCRASEKTKATLSSQVVTSTQGSGIVTRAGCTVTIDLEPTQVPKRTRTSTGRAGHLSCAGHAL